MNRLLQTHEFDSLISRSAEAGVQFWAPVCEKGRGRFSDTDLVKYGQIVSADQIVWDQKTYRSAKEIVLSITETMFRFDQGQIREVASEERSGIYILCRSCDIHAFSRLDNVFLHNGPLADPYYRGVRERISFILMECAEPFESCFCVAAGTSIPDSFSAAVRREENGISILSDSPFLIDSICCRGTECDISIRFPQADGIRVIFPGIEEIPERLFTHQLWEEYSRRCIGCGRCNTSCPTCSCFSVHDILYPSESGGAGERRRVWDGCHLDGFTDMAGGMEFRKENGSRMRFKTFHKIYDYRKRYGINMCVGCGRCDDVCPEYISFANCINKVSGALESQEGEV